MITLSDSSDDSTPGDGLSVGFEWGHEKAIEM